VSTTYIENRKVVTAKMQPKTPSVTSHKESPRGGIAVVHESEKNVTEPHQLSSKRRLRLKSKQKLLNGIRFWKKTIFSTVDKNHTSGLHQVVLKSPSGGESGRT